MDSPRQTTSWRSIGTPFRSCWFVDGGCRECYTPRNHIAQPSLHNLQQGERGGAVSPIDLAAVAALREQRIDWRFKGMPADGSTVGELAAAGLDLFEGGFVGPLVVLD